MAVVFIIVVAVYDHCCRYGVVDVVLVVGGGCVIDCIVIGFGCVVYFPTYGVGIDVTDIVLLLLVAVCSSC